MTESFSDFEYAASRIEALRKNWQGEFAEARRRRNIRYHNVSTKELRALGKIAPDAFWITRRIADSNIRREMAPYVAYVEQSRDAAKFKPRGDLPLPIEPLEQEFTQMEKYDRWNVPLFACFDGSVTHGWDAVEVIFDEECPGGFRNHHPGREHLIFQIDVSNIQQSDLVCVGCSTTVTELRDWVEDYEFDKKASDEVIEWAKAQENRMEARILIFKVYSKIDAGNVQVAWYSDHAHSWLKKPEKLWLGLADKESLIYENEYPIEILQYTISENEVITDSKGRVFLDEHDQEACTVLATSFCNRANRSSYILASNKQPDPNATEASEKQTALKLGDGMIFKEPVDFFNIEPPDASILNGMQMLITQNAAEVGQTNFAVNNRKDSRKTATEIQAANQQSAMLNSVQVTLLSSFLRNVFARNFAILQSRVLQGKVTSRIDKAYYQMDYDILPAGDIEVIRRAEMTQQRMQDWPVVQTTAAAQSFLEDFLRDRYGNQAQKYIDAIETGNQKDNLIKGLGNALQTVVKDPMAMKNPQTIKAMTELYAEYQRVMTPPGQKPQEQPMPEGVQDNAPQGGGEQY
jgi:hypothetical protein